MECYVLFREFDKRTKGCPTTADTACLRCNIEGCIKCPDLLIQDTRTCINSTCPSGYLQQWSSSPDFMGKICIPQGMSAPLLAVITGLISGCIICFSCLIIAIILIKRKRRKNAIKKKLIHETTMDRSDFLRQLEEMRPNAEYFLAMLNDTRRQIRKLYLSGEIETANAYRPVIRDLAKILILLNRPIELIPAPPNDWNHIYTWAEQSLEKYKPKIGQLIDFFQSPTTTTTSHHGNNGGIGGINSDYYDNGSQQFSDNYGGSFNGSSFYGGSRVGDNGPNNASDLRVYHLHQNHLQLQRNKNFQLFGSLISLHELEDNSRTTDPFGSNFNTLRAGIGGGINGGGPNSGTLGIGGNLITDLNASSLWLEDEFFRLGFRPQDEITTEL
ncbi:uncharacterized protein LOC129611466 [Condylostylus longicornis]|uniref:uncharacterized protein LOC129611466 n=1 Tax=Condylostylus longicornis TaxID=2530218 RepID=UPI00244E4450|nr:uncharacterized protein LOC129611466 [Condylostylus longicornis]